MTSAEGDAKLVLTRERGGWRDWFRSYSVMIDQQEAGRVKRGERVELPITAGHHEVFVKIDWCKSPTLEVDAAPDEVVEMSCAPGGSAGSGLQDVVVGTDSYITLTRLHGSV